MTFLSLSTAHSPQGSPTLTGRPALSQRLSGRGLPARMTHVRDTGCPSRTRMMEALLAICGGAVRQGERQSLRPERHRATPRFIPMKPATTSRLERFVRWGVPWETAQAAGIQFWRCIGPMWWLQGALLGLARAPASHFPQLPDSPTDHVQ